MTGGQMLLSAHLLVIALGIGFSASNFINTRLALAQPGAAATGLGLQRRTIARLGDGVITLIWLTGLALLRQRGMADLPPAFHLKMAFVVALTLFHGLGRWTGGRMARQGGAELLPRLSVVIGLGFASAVAALVCAVAAFAA